jgi:hypothetical protein
MMPPLPARRLEQRMQLMKLLMTWDIIPGQEQAYIDFNAKEFVPRLMKLGLRPVDSWFTLYGDAPQVTVGWVTDDVEVIRRAVDSDDWRELEEELTSFVTNFRYKIVPFTGLFQM